MAVSAATFAAGASIVSLATAADFPDALAVGPRAAKDAAPALLTWPDRLPDATSAELVRLQPAEVAILGGPAATYLEDGLPVSTRFASPFHYANNSRALVPGVGFNLASTVVLALIGAGLLAATAWAFERRDYRASLWPRRHARRVPRRDVTPRRMPRTVWTATLRRGRRGLLAWSVSSAADAALMASLQPAVMDVWDAFESYGAMAGGRQGIAPEAQYMSLAVELVMPIVAAFVITQAAGWVADLDQGRTELILATPVSATRLVWERLLATTVGVAIVALAALGGLTATALAIGAPLNAGGVARAAAGCILLGAALADAAATIVALLRTNNAMIIETGTASYRLRTSKR